MARAVRFDLIADASRFTRGMRDAERSSKRFTDHTNRAGSAVKSAFAAFSAATVVLEMRKWVAAARDANRVAAQTDAVIRSTHGAAGLSAKGFADLAKQISRNVAVDDDLIQSGANILATFTAIKAGGPDRIFERTEAAAVDMAAALNQGQVTASGLQSANLVLGKALQDPIAGLTRLQRVGVSFSATQKQQIADFVKHGQVAKAQGVILAEVNREFGGSAAAAVTPAKRLAVTWGNMQEVLGNLLIPALDRGATILANGLEVVDRNRTAFGLLFGVLATGAAVVGTLIVAEKIHRAVVDATKVATEAWAAVQKGMNLLLGQTTVEATAAAGAEGRLAGATTVAGTAAGGAASKFALLRAGLISIGAVAAPLWAVLEEGKEQFRMLKGESDTALDPPLLVIRGIARTFGFFKTESKEATVQTGEQATAMADAARVAGVQAAAMEAVKAKTTELTGKLKELKQGFREQVASVRESVQGYEGLITQSDVTTKQVIGDLHNQVRNFKTYSGDVKRLIKAGVSPAAIEELSKKGPQYVHALATGSNRELKTYKQYWRDRQNEVKGSFATAMEQQYQNLVKKMRAMQREINRLKGKTVDVGAVARITLFEKTRQALLALGIKGYGTKFLAAGGRITEGTGPTADDVLVWGSKGETMVPARSASKPEFKAWAASERIPGYADGGILGGFRDPAVQATRRYGGLAADRLAAVMGDALGRAVEKGMGAFGGGMGFPGGGKSAEAIKAFIRFVDRLPYKWGGVGPGGYDCSGLVGEIWNRITGNKSYVRRWTTGGGSTVLRGLGFQQSKGSGVYLSGPNRGQSYQVNDHRRHAFEVGFEHHGSSTSEAVKGHTAGSFMGLNFEAANPRAGIRIAGAARGARSFPWAFYLPYADRKFGVNNPRVADQGAVLSPGLNMLDNRTGRSEPLVPPGPGIDYDRLGKVVAREIAKALREQPLQAVTLLDRQKVSRGLATEALWQARR